MSKFSQLSFCQKLFFLNQTPSCICSMCPHCIGKVSNCSIKTVVGVDRPMKALCIYKSLIREKLSKFSLLSFCPKLFFLNQTPSCICSILLTVPRRYFFCGSFMFLFCLVFAMFCARLFICALWSPAGKGLTSWLSFVVSSVSLSLSHWYPGSGVVLNCIDS